MVFCTVVSPNWFNHALVSIFSLFKTNPYPPMKVYILSDNINKEQLKVLDNLLDYFGEGYEVIYIDMEKMYNTFIPSQINVDNRFSRYTLYRLFIPYLCKEDRILYYDGDALICNDISDFFNISFKDKWLLGVEDIGLQFGYKESIGLSNMDNYINAGVAMLRMDKIRESKMADLWIKEANTFFYPCHDQDIWAISLQGLIDYVDLKYNVSLSTGIEIDKSQIVCCHYAGIKNPWVEGLPFSELWYQVEKEYNEIFLNYKPKQRIPKILHGFWFGKNKMPQKMQDYLFTWKEKCPDYEIKIWDESTYDVNKYEYTKQAYKAKKYSFVSDVAKLEILLQYGGIALDLDIEILQNFDDFLYHRCFTGYQENYMVTAVLGSEPNHPYIKYLLSYYDNKTFNEKPNTYIIDEMAKQWFVEKVDDITWLNEGVAIYPEEFFCPYSHKEMKSIPTDKSYTIHHFTNTWGGKTKVMPNKFKIDLQDIFDDSVYWQMNTSEKSSIMYLLEKIKNKNVSIEVGSFRGGFLRILDKYFKKTYSCDLDHTLLTNKGIYKNVEFITGDSKNTLPELVNKFNSSEEIVNFILIDGDHEYIGLQSDIKNILKIKPKDDLIILIHDSWYNNSRACIIETKWSDCSYVHHVDTDFVAGDLIYSGMYDKDILMGGLALIIMSPEIREEELIIKQSQDKLYCRISKLI
jgi:lipopolysaccharide biosynthesis glycosyltransferase